MSPCNCFRCTLNRIVYQWEDYDLLSSQLESIHKNGSYNSNRFGISCPFLNHNPIIIKSIEETFETFYEYWSKRMEDVNTDGYQMGDVLNGRYQITNLLGSGTFSNVLQVEDKDSKINYALKFVTKEPTYRRAALFEVFILHKLNNLEHNRKQRLFLQMFDWFHYGGHVCIVTEMLSISLLTWIQQQRQQPNHNLIGQIGHIAHQLINCVKVLHSYGMAHTDLKPENILLVSDDRTDIRLIDFGSTMDDYSLQHEPSFTTVSTRYYRAPEVFLQLGWSYTADLWSIGCILFELYHGTPLFVSYNDVEHFIIMEKVIGPFPDWLRNAFRQIYGCSNDGNDTITTTTTRTEPIPLHEYIIEPNNELHVQLFDLIQQLIRYEACERISLEHALNHPFFEMIMQTNNEQGLPN
ncbi:Dual specificity protein kinase clk2 [Blomia tropicalis]|nr:Dual specificity protein kinase clk2 [Blomia tropicalis]